MVERSGGVEQIFLVSLYLDGVPYTNTDSVVGIWLINMVAGVRHMLGLVRKSITCRCGCRGWDTFFPILQFLLWSFRALASGNFPGQRHGGTAWTGAGAEAAVSAGKPLKAKGMLL